MPKVIGVLATFDTKGQQAQYVREQLEKLGSQALLVDLGVTGTPTPPGDVTREQVARAGGMPLGDLLRNPSREEALHGLVARSSVPAVRACRPRCAWRRLG